MQYGTVVGPDLGGLVLEFLFYFMTMNLITSFSHKHDIDTEPAACVHYYLYADYK